jgi:hypothetical protein
MAGHLVPEQGELRPAARSMACGTSGTRHVTRARTGCLHRPVASGSMTTALDSLPKIGAPATRALNAAGYSSLRQLAGVPRSELAQLHGMRPKALRIIEEQLEQHT